MDIFAINLPRLQHLLLYLFSSL
uniref:Uncharacterized protein n=1 Tax=Arundo donax TaxID=35708 RepID=A0A0A8Z791_ARUDO